MFLARNASIYIGRHYRLAVFAGAALIAVAAWPNSERPETPVRSAVEVELDSPADRARVLALTDDVWVDRGGAVVAVFDRDEIAALGLAHRVVVADIDEVASAERARLAGRVRVTDGGEGWFTEYRDVGEVAEFLDMLDLRHPRLATLERLGTSIEGWPIRALKISNGGPINVALNGGHHAREWISVMVPLCVADRLLRGHDSDPRVRAILDQVTFYVAPLINPDGYQHSWEVDRYWRKNRRGGHGVDLNRNYSVAWGGRGSSGRRSSQTYRGEHAFSEPETRAMRKLFTDRKITAHLDFHSYSQLILYPWSHSRSDPPDRDKFAAFADRMVTAMYAAHGKRYKILAGSELYGAAGTAMDWAYGEAGALSFTVELRPPQGRGGGFVLPPEQIIPTCDESYAAVLELAELSARHSAWQPTQVPSTSR